MQGRHGNCVLCATYTSTVLRGNWYRDKWKLLFEVWYHPARGEHRKTLESGNGMIMMVPAAMLFTVSISFPFWIVIFPLICIWCIIFTWCEEGSLLKSGYLSSPLPQTLEAVLIMMITNNAETHYLLILIFIDFWIFLNSFHVHNGYYFNKVVKWTVRDRRQYLYLTEFYPLSAYSDTCLL